MKTIKLTQGHYAMVDDEDFEFLNQWKWRVLKAQRKNTPPVWYAHRTTPRPHRKAVYMHREVLRRFGFEQFQDSDHKDGNGLNNQRDNLRPVTRSQNLANARKKTGCTSRFKGVYWHKTTNKWMARIDRAYIGTFSDESDAARAYDDAASIRFGDCARLNYSQPKAV